MSDASRGAELFYGPFVLEGATIHEDQVVFACGGRLWRVARSGGRAQAVTSGASHDSMPHFSPDGAQLAFLRRSERLVGRAAASPDDPLPTSAVYDVYVRTESGGEERRLTYHPGRDLPVGWTIDSARVLLNSNREGNSRLFTMSLGDQIPTPLPLPGGFTGCFSPDGKRMAYLPRARDYYFVEIRHYRGGECAPLWIADLDSGAVEKVTDETSNARDPMWIREKVYFLSDLDGRFDLYVYDLATKATRKLTNLRDFGVREAAADETSIVLVGRGGLQIFDLASEVARPMEVGIERDEQALRPRIVNALSQVQSVALGPDGKQAVVCARGDVLLVDTGTGKVANVTKSSGVAEREASLSPDGKRMAYFSDASGEYVLTVRDNQSGKETAIAIEPRPSFYRELAWSPSGNHISFSDKRLGIWLADLSKGDVSQIDSSVSSAQGLFQLNWSPEGKYLAYSKYGENRLPGIYVYDLAAGRSYPVTPDDDYAKSPVFDRSGRYLYFLSSPNAPAADYQWGVMSAVLSQPLVIRHLNAIVLVDGDPAPVASGAPNLDVRWNERRATAIDFDGIEERIVPIDVRRNLPAELAAGEAGVLYMVVEEWPATPGSGQPPSQAIHRLDLRSPAEIKKVIPLVATYSVSRDGKTVLCAGGANLRLAAFQGSKVTLRPVSLGALPVPVDPGREWRQIVHESWRVMRDFFYDPKLHGLDWPEIERRYAEFIPGIRSREELNVLMRRMLGHVSVSHLGVGGGDVSSNLDEPEPVGLLGADLEVSDGLYRMKRVLRSGDYDASSPVRAPLAQPGSEVMDGEYLFAIDDEPLDAKQNIYVALRGKASRPVRLLVGKTPDGALARTVRVVPLSDEASLRMANWARENKKAVHDLSDGKLGYFHIPTWGNPDVQTFLRGFFATQSKAGVIIDQRHNGGGITPDFFIEMLSRRPLYYYLFRDGDDLAVPINGRHGGATVLLINENNGSAAETFALMFKLAKVGPTVGHRTSGGGIGPYGAASRPPQLVDGGRLQIPARGAYDPSGAWGIENEGVRPDIAVEIMPDDWRAGRDPQLEAAVKAALESVDAWQPSIPNRPPFPVHP
ncbi:MAG: PD40 domain-containing protein [Planctomycetia bacterium]|nr:PD40 domain-containing protein [Planctomycetia bacterium]